MKYGKYVLAAMMALGFANVAFAEEEPKKEKTETAETPVESTETAEAGEAAE